MAQLRSLRVAKTQSVLSDNFRPTRPLNARKVFVTKGNYNSSETAPKSIKRERYDPYHEKPEETDHFFLLIMSIIIFFMQCGFAFMEAGAVRSKNTVNILIKNWLDMCIGALVYWAVGFAITFGGSDPFLSPFMGTSYFFFIGMPGNIKYFSVFEYNYKYFCLEHIDYYRIQIEYKYCSITIVPYVMIGGTISIVRRNTIVDASYPLSCH